MFYLDMDSLASYRVASSNAKPLTKKDMEKMKKIMRRVPTIKKRNDEYHKKEAEEAENIFSQKLQDI